MRAGLESAGGFDTVWANDVCAAKRAMYESNFGGDVFRVGDVRSVTGDSVPTLDVATAGFPCVDLSLAGRRAGLAGDRSGLFFEFARILDEMGSRRPTVVLVENVPSFVSSRGGSDLAVAVETLNSLGYVCDLAVIDSRWFVPQSRRRLFILGTLDESCCAGASDGDGDTDAGTGHGRHGLFRPAALRAFIEDRPGLRIRRMFPDEPAGLPFTATAEDGLEGVAEHLEPDDERWWPAEQMTAFDALLSGTHQRRLAALRTDRTGQDGKDTEEDTTNHAARRLLRTAFRRTRGGVAVWEIRNDDIAGCLRTAQGGSSRQALIEIDTDHNPSSHRLGYRARWLTAREAARLQGVPDTWNLDTVTERQALTAFGDAVTVPVVAWIAARVIRPMLVGTR